MDRRVFVGIPTYDGKDYCLDKFAKALNSIVYPIKIFIIDSSKTDKNISKLKKKFPDAQIEWMPWDGEKHILNHLSDVREVIRNAFLFSKCRNMLMLDSDMIITNDMFNKMLDIDYHWVGCVTMFGIGDKGKEIDVNPLVFKTGKILMGKDKKGLDFYTHKELKDMPKVFDCHAVSIGCSMVDRRIMTDIPFVMCDIVAMGEDLWWFNNASEKGYHAVCINEEIEHLTDNWGSFGKSNPLSNFNMEIVTRVGDDICKEVNMTELRKEASKEIQKKESKSSKNSKKK